MNEPTPWPAPRAASRPQRAGRPAARGLSARSAVAGLALVALLLGACTPQGTPRPESTSAPTPAATEPLAPTPSASPTPKDSPTPEATPSPTATEKPSATPTPKASPSATPSPTATEKPSATPTPKASPSATAGVSPTATEEPSATPTPKVSPTVDASRTPTVEQQRATLQKRVDDWISGKTKLDPSELIIIPNPHKVEHMPLGTTRAVNYNTEDFTSYQGLLLGITQIDGQHVAMIGFESKDGKRYSLAFNIGPNDGLLVEAIQRPKFTLGFVEGEVHQRIPPAVFARRLAGLAGKPIFFRSPVADPTKYPSASDEVKKQLFPTVPVARATYDFVYAATNGDLKPPLDLLAPFFNRIPTSVQVESLPKVSQAVQTGNWVTSP